MKTPKAQVTSLVISNPCELSDIDAGRVIYPEGNANFLFGILKDNALCMSSNGLFNVSFPFINCHCEYIALGEFSEF